MTQHRSSAHPISEENVEKAFKSKQGNSEMSEYSVEDLEKGLTKVQDVLEEELPEQLRQFYHEGPKHELVEEGETKRWYINTYDYVLIESLTPDPFYTWGEIVQQTNLPDNEAFSSCIWKAHHLQFKELVENRDLQRITGQRHYPLGFTPVVVQKTYQWIGGETLSEQETQLLLELGLTPAEVLDYRHLAHGHHPDVQEWADLRGTSVQEVQSNAERATEKLEDIDQ